MVLILLGDVFGYVALAFVIFTASFMLVRRRLLRLTKNLNLLRKVHVYAATLAGLFIILHVAYFVSWPLTLAVLSGYASAALAAVVWITGTAFLERFRDSLFYHGTMSFATVALITVHAAGAGLNIPVGVAVVVLAAVAFMALFTAQAHLSKLVEAPEARGC